MRFAGLQFITRSGRLYIKRVVPKAPPIPQWRLDELCSQRIVVAAKHAADTLRQRVAAASRADWRRRISAPDWVPDDVVDSFSAPTRMYASTRMTLHDNVIFVVSSDGNTYIRMPNGEWKREDLFGDDSTEPLGPYEIPK